MADRPDADTLAAWQALLGAHAGLTGALDRELRERHDLTIEQYDVLVQLQAHDGRLRMGRLADALLFTRWSCTRLVDRLSDAGLVEREPDPVDGRGRVAVLTRQGRARLRRAAATHLAGIQREFGDRLAPGEASMLAEVLGRLSG